MAHPDPLAVEQQPVDGPRGESCSVPAGLVGTGGPGVRVDLLRSRADTLRAKRTPFVQATVVRAVKPTSAKAGDRALVLPDGSIEGFVGGTCAESSVRLQSLRVLRAHEPVVLRIIPGTPLADVATQDRSPAAEGLVTVSNPCASGGMLEIFLEGIFPPMLVQVSGDAPIARALHRVGEALGYEIRPVSGSGQPVAPDATAVIVASHGRDEEPVLSSALSAGVPYVALVASRRRGQEVAAALAVQPGDAQRLHTPAGLNIGARTPEEVAVSIFAEIIAERPRTPAPVPANEAIVRGQEAEESQEEGSAPDRPLRVYRLLHGSATIDPVCGMTVAMTEASPHLTHDGRMWYFCGPGCRQAFADHPACYQG